MFSQQAELERHSIMARRTSEQLRSDALRIWQAGVDAVDSRRLVREAIRREDDALVIGDEVFELGSIGRVIVVGCGKAGAGMAAGVEDALGEALAREKRLTGWVNVPADCVGPLGFIRLHGARPAGKNEPTEEGIVGTTQILSLLSTAELNDLVLVLISGGGSALMPAPIDGVSLADKQAVTRFLSGAGADIGALNTVRKALSLVKGGGLARACRASRLVTLVISDVLGDPLDVIASGPTVESTTTTADALAVLTKFGAEGNEKLQPIFAALRAKQQAEAAGGPTNSAATKIAATRRVTNLIIGNNAVAVDAAGVEAEKLGYSHAMISATTSEGAAEGVGRHLAEMAIGMRRGTGPDCLITGGEPTVKLADEHVRGKGGRNQQLALAAMQRLIDADALSGIVLLSGGTDGEDGPTDAAGAIVDEELLSLYADRRHEAADYLSRNDAYNFFQPHGDLIKTGPTHTNVCDLRVVVVDKEVAGE
jgi:glycerate 2-kinase